MGTHDGDEQPNVGLCELSPNEVVFTCKDLFDLVERGEQLDDGRLVRGLLGRKARKVDAVCGSCVSNDKSARIRRTVDVRVHPFIERIDLRAMRLGIKV